MRVVRAAPSELPQWHEPAGFLSIAPAPAGTVGGCELAEPSEVARSAEYLVLPESQNHGDGSLDLKHSLIMSQIVLATCCGTARQFTAPD